MYAERMAKMNIRTIPAIFIALVLLAGAAVAETPKEIATESPSGMSCLVNMKNVLEPVEPTLRRVVLTSVTKVGKDEVIMGQAFKKFPDGRRMILTILAPEGLKGMTNLYWEQDNQVMIWTYSPAVRRIRKLEGGIGPEDTFLKTDFTYSDIGLIPLPKVCMLLEQSEHMGIKAYKVEEKVNKAQADTQGYSRIVTWVGVDSLLPLQRDYYDFAGRLWKSLFFKEVLNVNHKSTPLLIQMKNVQTGTYTNFKITALIDNAHLPDELFVPAKLANTSSSPLWEKLTQSNKSEK